MKVKNNFFSKNDKKHHGFLLVDKSVGPTSFDVIYQLRKITEIKKLDTPERLILLLPDY